MKQKEFFKIVKETARRRGVKLTYAEIKELLKILEEACLITGLRLDENEEVVLNYFLKIKKKKIPPRHGVYIGGENKGEHFYTDEKYYTQISNTPKFKKKTEE